MIGMPYRLGGGDGYIDCIQMVYVALEDMGIPTPPFNQDWYNQSRFRFCRDFLTWGKRVIGQSYDGDVLLFDGQGPMFGVVWEGGALHINQMTERVAWCPLTQLGKHWSVRYCPTKKN